MARTRRDFEAARKEVEEVRAAVSTSALCANSWRSKFGDSFRVMPMDVRVQAEADVIFMPYNYLVDANVRARVWWEAADGV